MWRGFSEGWRDFPAARGRVYLSFSLGNPLQMWSDFEKRSPTDVEEVRPPSTVTEFQTMGNTPPFLCLAVSPALSPSSPSHSLLPQSRLAQYVVGLPPNPKHHQKQLLSPISAGDNQVTTARPTFSVVRLQHAATFIIHSLLSPNYCTDINCDCVAILFRLGAIFPQIYTSQQCRTSVQRISAGATTPREIGHRRAETVAR